jgi:pimeloyl-ACP methyl ester carboxylesterase
MTKPTILIVPGSFCPAYVYDPMVKDIQSHGYDVQAIDLRSVGGPEVSGIQMSDDATHIASFIKPLVDAGKEVVLVAHSYGGTPGTESVKGFAKQEGKPGGVTAIVYMTCVVPAVGATANETLANPGEESGLPPFVAVDVCTPILLNLPLYP